MKALTIGLIVAAGVFALTALAFFMAALWTAGDGTPAVDTSTRLLCTGVVSAGLAAIAGVSAVFCVGEIDGN